MNEDGAWAIVDLGEYEYTDSVYPDELSALRMLNARGHGSVEFVEWGGKPSKK